MRGAQRTASSAPVLVGLDQQMPLTSGIWSSVSFFFFFFNVYIFLRERVGAGEGQRERKTQNPKQGPDS